MVTNRHNRTKKTKLPEKKIKPIRRLQNPKNAMIPKNIKNNNEKPTIAAIKHAVTSMLNADKFVLPRAMPTYVRTMSVRRTFELSGVTSAAIVVKPSLDNFITKYQKSNNVVAAFYTFYDWNKVMPRANPVQFCLDLKFTAPNGQELPMGYIENKGQSYVTYSPHGNSPAWKGSAASNIRPVYYVSNFSLTVEQIRVDISAGGTAPNLNFNIYTATHALITTTTIVPVLGVYTLIPPAGVVGEAYFDMVFSPTDTSLGRFNWPEAGIVLVDSTPITAEIFSPTAASAWGAVQQVCTGWSCTGISVLVRFEGSNLENGGDCGTALLPTGSRVSNNYNNLVDYIGTLTKNQYRGPIKLGTHLSYLPDQVSQYYFQDMDVKELSAPVMVQAYLAQDVDKLKMLCTVQSTWEFLTADPTQTLVVSPGHAAFFELMISSLQRVLLQNQNGLASENPEHWKKIKDFASSVANNPAVQKAAKDVLSFGTKALINAAPLLLGMLL